MADQGVGITSDEDGEEIVRLLDQAAQIVVGSPAVDATPAEAIRDSVYRTRCRALLTKHLVEALGTFSPPPKAR